MQTVLSSQIILQSWEDIMSWKKVELNNECIATVSWIEKDKMKVVEMHFPVDLDNETIYENVIRHLQEDYNQIITEENIHLSVSTEVQNAKTIN